MALSQSDLDALDAAIASGRLTVRLGDRAVTYQSVADLLKAREHVSRLLHSAVSVARRAPRYQAAVFDDA